MLSVFPTVRWQGAQCLAGSGPSQSRAAQKVDGLPVALRAGLSATYSQHGNGTDPQGPHSRVTATFTKPPFSEPAPFKETGCVEQGESHYSPHPPGLDVLCVKPTVSRFPVHLVKPGL